MVKIAHVARIDESGICREVHVINNSDLPNNGEFSEEVEIAANAFQHSLGLMGEWRLTSYNNNFRNVYAGVGYTFDPDANDGEGAFYPPEAPEAPEE